MTLVQAVILFPFACIASWLINKLIDWIHFDNEVFIIEAYANGYIKGENK